MPKKRPRVKRPDAPGDVLARAREKKYREEAETIQDLRVTRKRQRMAARERHNATVEALLAAKAELNPRDKDDTFPLFAGGFLATGFLATGFLATGFLATGFAAGFAAGFTAFLTTDFATGFAAGLAGANSI